MSHYLKASHINTEHLQDGIDNAQYKTTLEGIRDIIIDVLSSYEFLNRFTQILGAQNIQGIQSDKVSAYTRAPFNFVKLLTKYLNTGDSVLQNLSYVENLEEDAEKSGKMQSLQLVNMVPLKTLNSIVRETLTPVLGNSIDNNFGSKLQGDFKKSLITAFHLALDDLGLSKNIPERLKMYGVSQAYTDNNIITGVLGNTTSNKIRLFNSLDIKKEDFEELLQMIDGFSIENLHPGSPNGKSTYEINFIKELFTFICSKLNKSDQVEEVKQNARKFFSFIKNIFSSKDVYIYLSSLNNYPSIIKSFRSMIEQGKGELSVLTCPDYSGNSKGDGTYEYNFLRVNSGLGTVTKKALPFVEVIYKAMQEIGVDVKVSHYLPSFECKGDGFESSVCRMPKDQFISTLVESGKIISHEYEKYGVDHRVGVSSEVISDEEMETMKDELYEQYLKKLKTDKQYFQQFATAFNNRRPLYEKWYPQRKSIDIREYHLKKEELMRSLIQEHRVLDEKTREELINYLIGDFEEFHKDYPIQLPEDEGKYEQRIDNVLYENVVQKIQVIKEIYVSVYGESKWDTTDKTTIDRENGFMNDWMIVYCEEWINNESNVTYKNKLKAKYKKEDDETEEEYMQRIAIINFNEKIKVPFLQFKLPAVKQIYSAFSKHEGGLDENEFIKKYAIEMGKSGNKMWLQRNTAYNKNKKVMGEENSAYEDRINKLRESKLANALSNQETIDGLMKSRYHQYINRALYTQKFGKESETEYQTRLRFIAYHQLLRDYKNNIELAKKLDNDFVSWMETKQIEKESRESDCLFKKIMFDEFIYEKSYELVDFDVLKSKFTQVTEDIAEESDDEYYERLKKQFLRQIAEYEVMARSFGESKENQIMIASDSRPMYDIAYGMNNYSVLYGQGKETQDYEGA